MKPFCSQTGLISVEGREKHLFPMDLPSSLVPLFQSESKCETILRTYENDFDLHENETACRTHFHVRGFALIETRFETGLHKRTQKYGLFSTVRG